MLKDTKVILEDEAPTYDDISESFVFQIHRMKRAIFKHSNFLMNDAGVNLQLEQLPIIMILQRRNLSQRELSDITMRDKSSILRSVNALEKKGIVEVRKDTSDKRKNILNLSLDGMNLAKNIRALMKKSEDEVLSVFTNKERALALKTLRGYADRLEKL
ncbi:MarR family transcriptional regulator [Flavobacterium sp. LS1R49]|uniref:MarR family transcriptional regulator n=1 Tax=Flavobacterium shii TaxID=2987687 RepID=A0A9X3C7I2_9FLAO|nr:MarR family transcriptional regulator [Flavobacterium shii]MCV9928558.1 MarR family transcriptional regulator [Flavobacterium shii]